jgi:hypothetical protein
MALDILDHFRWNKKALPQDTLRKGFPLGIDPQSSGSAPA